jgi:hypothetical protein
VADLLERHGVGPPRYLTAPVCEVARDIPDGAGGLDLQPFFDLITIHELGHAFDVLGALRPPTFWLSEIFFSLALHAFVATRLPASLPTFEVLSARGGGDSEACRPDARR